MCASARAHLHVVVVRLSVPLRSLTAGPVLGFGRAVDLAADAGINRTSAGLYLGRTPVLQTVARGHYAVRGAVTA
jgi:hypothetical protein